MNKKEREIVINAYKKCIEQSKDRIKSYEAGIKEEEETINHFQILINDFGEY